MQRLTILHDDRDGLCRWLKSWAKNQPTFVDLLFVRADSEEGRRFAHGPASPGPPGEIVAVSDEGQVYKGDSAWIMMFYALEEFREWSFRLATPALRPLARRAFVLLSQERPNVDDWLALSDRDAVLVFNLVHEQAASSLQKIHRMVADRAPGETR